MQIKGIIQIAHGVTEHVLAYEEIAQQLVKEGYVVIGNDHLGHGKTNSPKRMYFGEKGSWKYIVEDLFRVKKLINNIHPNLKHVFIGVSLGSFAVRHYLISHPNESNGAILIGTGYTSKVENFIAKVITWMQEIRHGDKATTKLINYLAFGMYDKYFSDKKTEFSWLFASKNSLNRYLNDPLRGRFITVGLFRELLHGMDFTSRRKNIKKMNKDTPIFVMSGENDPVGNFGKTVNKYVSILKHEGFLNTDIQLYKDKRHHLLLDDDNSLVVEDILDWIEYYT